MFVTTKLDNDATATTPRRGALDESLRELGLDHVDLSSSTGRCRSEGRYVETWKALEKLKADGKARSIGVSNFTVEHLDRLARADGHRARGEPDRAAPAVPAGGRCAPTTPSTASRTEAWSPIGQGKGLLDAPEFADIAQAHGKSPAQGMAADADPPAVIVGTEEQSGVERERAHRGGERLGRRAHAELGEAVRARAQLRGGRPRRGASRRSP